ncbi:hypothetical protein RHRU231_390140 [Rhodococcus ruber]|uniref:Uncharacterized protein n=1 Tax=Rhodococcus ruber TaxID=1830 RepID=A0A098BHQ9_9NOCA|nr:hypothetical protein RHRU231_390140 [Rhodococcus ruber]
MSGLPAVPRHGRWRSGRVPRGQFLEQDRHAEVERVDADGRGEFEDFENFVCGDAQIECGPDVPLQSGPVHVGAGGIDRNAQQLDDLRREHTAFVGLQRGSQVVLGPSGIEFVESVPQRVPTSFALEAVDDGRSCVVRCHRPLP